MVQIPDSTEQEIKARCESARKINGTFQNNRWKLELVYKNGNIITELAEAPARFNRDALGKAGHVAFWVDDSRLSEYLRRRKVNENHVAKGGRWQYAPYSWEELSHTAACVVEFNLQNITSTIANEETKQKTSTGHLSLNPSLLPYSHGAEHYRVYLKIEWKT